MGMRCLQDTLRAIDWPVMGIFELSADGQSAEEAAKVTRRYEPLTPAPFRRAQAGQACSQACSTSSQGRSEACSS
jgi:hypothetical protein